MISTRWRTAYVNIIAVCLMLCLTVMFCGCQSAGSRPLPTNPTEAGTGETPTEAVTTEAEPEGSISGAVTTEEETTMAPIVITLEETTDEDSPVETIEITTAASSNPDYDKNYVASSIAAIYPMEYASTKSTYVGIAGLTANDYLYRLVYPISQEALIRIDEIITQMISPADSEVEKIRKVHDWIVANINYDWDFAAQTVDTGLFHGLSVCNGYADTFYVFMTQLGIPCYSVLGYSKPAGYYEAVYHMWNTVKLSDGCWYYIDCTWDDPTSVYGVAATNEVRDTYFLKSRAFMDKDHWMTSGHPSPEAKESWTMAVTETETVEETTAEESTTEEITGKENSGEDILKRTTEGE